MGKILLLDDLTINKIAAGEVIERPASAIKEMMENAIDANANNITIEIKDGGISYIKIIDNGHGIEKDDLEMAFERHATSKIRHSDDLDKVASMGFRGEALASIAAIANVELISKTAEEEIGYKVVVEGGQVLQKEEIGCQTGTTIIVKNLFFNTPVRYKFLKKDYTETGYIEDVVTRIALANPNISFKLINAGKTILQTSGTGDLKNTIYSIYGKDVSQGLIEIDYQYEDMKITGVIGKPEIARSNRSNQLFYVNKRYIKDKVLTAATEQAYKGKIDSGKFGFVVLNIEMPQTKVDVNVHPAKLEVRFAEESKVFQAIFHAIKDGLQKNEANSQTIEKVDNIIIQTKETVEHNTEIKEEEKPKNYGGFFSWRKNKNMFGEPNNIIEDLYNEKKESDFPAFTEKVENKEEKDNNQIEDDPVNTSDVLQELKQINENIKSSNEEQENKAEQAKDEQPEEEINSNIEVEDKKLPDGTTYTYVGENKEKIEDLLRQLHPETYNKVEETQEIRVEEPINDTQMTQKFELIKENIEQLEEIAENDKENKDDFEKTNDEENTNEVEEQKNNESKVEERISGTKTNDFRKMYEKLFGTTPIVEENISEEKDESVNAVDIIKDNVSVFEGIEEFQKPTYKIIGLAFDSYIIAEIEKEMYIINVNTAKEKVMYEKLKKSYYNQVNKDSQMLLLPDIIELSNKQTEVIKENYDILFQAGFSFEEFGENTVKLTGVPTICLDLDTKELFSDILNELNTVARTSKQEKEEKFIATIAEKISEKSKLEMEIPEINNLMDELLVLKNPFTYNEEKTIAIKMTKYDIERKFSRK